MSAVNASPQDASATPSAPPLIRLERVYAGFGNRPVLRNLSLSLHAGRHLALIGPNGSGKSTLLRLLQGELRPLPDLPPDRPGRILYAFDGLEDASPLHARLHVRSVSPAVQRNYVRQGWNISGEEILLSGLDNAAMVYGELPAGCREQAAALAEDAGAARLLGMQAPAMSRGQLRFALILRALMSRPALLLLDEPFDGLDAPARESVARSIALAACRGSTLVVSAHKKEDLPKEIREILILRRGIPEHRPFFSPDDLFGQCAAPAPAHAPVPSRARAPVSAPASIVSRGYDAVSSLAHASVSAPAPAARPGDRSRPMGSGGSPDPSGLFSPLPVSPFVRDILALGPGSPPLFELHGVDVFIERARVLSGIDWTVRRGECWVLSGRNGSGKSTLLRLLYGEEFAAYGGAVLWRGLPRPGLEELRRGVGYVSDRLQDVYDHDLSAAEIVVSGLRGHIGLYEEARDEERALALHWLDRLGLARLAGTPFFSLSHGTMRRVLLARALASSPPVLLLDEPCSGLDGPGRALFLRSLEELAADGVTLVCVSHREEDLGPVFTHELRLEAGRIVSAGPRAGQGK